MGKPPYRLKGDRKQTSPSHLEAVGPVGEARNKIAGWPSCFSSESQECIKPEFRENSGSSDREHLPNTDLVGE